MIKIPNDSIRDSRCTSEYSMSSKSGTSRHNECMVPANSVSLIQKGYLSTKKSVMKRSNRKFYFLVDKCPHLYAFKDESCFERWFFSTRLWEKSASGDGIADPKSVCTVIRADRSVGDVQSNSHGITVLEGPASKFTARKFTTTSRPACDAWLESFQRIQIRRKQLHSSSSFERVASNRHTNSSYESPEKQNRCDSSASTFSLLQLHTSDSDHTQSIYSQELEIGQEARRKEKILLLVPGVTSTLTTTKTKLDEAKVELDGLLARGLTGPSRLGVDDDEMQRVNWRYGVPNFDVYDLAYIKGKTRKDQENPLANYVESYCQTFIMDMTYKSDSDDWVSVQQDQFHIQVNDGDKVAGCSLKEHDTFGLLYLTSSRITDDAVKLQNTLAAAFTKGFPVEVLEVYTQPPRCHFLWRHWGSFSGHYKGVKGNKKTIEIQGFGYMELDGRRMNNLRLFFKLSNLLQQLEDVCVEISSNDTSQ